MDCTGPGRNLKSQIEITEAPNLIFWCCRTWNGVEQASRTETPFNPIDGPIAAHRWPSQLFPMGFDGPSMAIDGI